MKPITRRDFIKGAAATGAALCLPGATPAPVRAMGGGGMGGGGMGGGGMGVTVIDPPVGAALRQPVPIAGTIASDGAYEVSVTAQTAAINVNGTIANLVTYNGAFPGPLIRARRGQLLRMRFHNGLPDDGQTNYLGHSTRMTNIHTHGLHVTPGMNMNGTYGDFMLAMADPGQDLTYEYDLRKHPAGNLNFYHPHIHGSVTDQMWGGMAAPLLIEDEITALAAFEEKVLVLKDIGLVGSDPAPHTSDMDYMQGLEGNTVMVNGQVNPRLAIAPGQVQRWRVVNASTARFYRLSLQGHAMYVVGTDGGLLDKPYRVTELIMSPGERADLLIKADQKTGSYKWLSLAHNRGMMNPLQQVTLMTLTYGGSKRSQSIPAVIDPSAKRVVLRDVGIDPAAPPAKRMALTMGMGGMGMGGMGGGGMGGGPSASTVAHTSAMKTAT